MAKIETYRCDVCKTLKQETNHWWTILVNRTAPLIVVQPLNFGALAVFLHENQEDIAAHIDTVAFEVCGHDCVNRKLAEILKP